MSLCVVRAVLPILVAPMLAAGCVRPTPTGHPSVKATGTGRAEPAIEGISANSYPVANGSTSTMLLGQLLLSRALGIQGEIRRVPLRSWGEPYPAMLVFPLSADPERIATYSRLLSQKAHQQGTHDAYLRLIKAQEPPPASPRTPDWASAAITGDIVVLAPRADLILVARPPSEDELKAAKEDSVEFDVRPCALDAFVFLVNAKNPVETLTLDQIRSIYTGKVKSWREVGGDDEPIAAFTRDRNSGSEELMRALVMKDLKMIEGGERMLMGMAGPIDAVSDSRRAIAYSVYYYEHVMRRRPENRLLAVNGVAPSSETIASRRYPLTTEVYVVTRKGLMPQEPAVKLRDWLLSDDGQRLIADSGYVPLRRVKN
jgi:hypothetical protein